MRSLCREDGLLESVENGESGREDDRFDRLREGEDIMDANLLEKLSFRSCQTSPGAGWTWTHSSFPCATVPVGIGICVTAGEGPDHPVGCCCIGCVAGNMGDRKSVV